MLSIRMVKAPQTSQPKQPFSERNAYLVQT
jgi:hypothetical protein